MSQIPRPPTDLLAPGHRLRTDYSPSGGPLRRTVGADGNVRAHWQPFVAGWDATWGPRSWTRRWTEARRLLRENGITYTADDDPADARPWDVDMFPLVLPADQWREIAAGIAQRARLLDLIIRDVYSDGRPAGPQGPAAGTGLRQPGFLRPCHGHARARRLLPASLRGRPGADERRAVAGGGGPDRCPAGTRLHAGEPDRLRPHVSGHDSRVPRRTAGVVFHRPAAEPPGPGAAASRKPAHRAVERGARRASTTSRTPTWLAT